MLRDSLIRKAQSLAHYLKKVEDAPTQCASNGILDLIEPAQGWYGLFLLGHGGLARIRNILCPAIDEDLLGAIALSAVIGMHGHQDIALLESPLIALRFIFRYAHAN